jgi:RNA polymerase sigma-70 factor (ECF subfamily)
MVRDTEIDVVRRLLAGDRQAVRDFYALYADALYSFAYYRMGRHAALAEEAVNETFHRGLLGLKEYDPSRAGIYTWLTSLGRGVITEILRRERRWRRHELSWERVDRALLDAVRALDREAMPDRILEREETRQLVRAALSQLSPKVQRLLELRYWKGETNGALARLLGITEKAVESLLARGRQAFHESLEILTRELGAIPKLEE